MSATIACLGIILFMPYIASGIGGCYRVRQKGHYDIVNPRQQDSELFGVGERASHAQKNCWEAAILFSGVLLAAQISGTSIESLTTCSILFVMFRTIYLISYLINFAKTRVFVFSAGLLTCIGILASAITV